ncbi:DUF4382 domain-containing protein [Algoriphagus lutimaris]|uniref:DUF4382 domain-containing protein n=1 Tax=Algoriphagus lutimaris TaxID=613197 RepID=UPI00196AC0D4|nr:DUF4382 domain-containing protein [Algoriphagus lutimaris]MBN3521251.1 DUF4382 domain-containing protein [Algoriphagus lutimaris]
MKNIFNYLMLLGVMLFAVACSNDDETPNGGNARVNFYLVDAPGDFEEVWIEVLAIRVKAEDDSMDDDVQGNDDDDENESDWIEIPYDEASPYVNLMDLTGENSLFIGSEDFPEGEIDQLRLVLGDDNYVIRDGERSDLTTPSAQQSGLKIKVDEDIEGGMSYNLVIDFDVAKSIVEAGNSGNIILKPVLRAYLEEAASGVMGQVFPAEAQPVAVNALKGDDEYNTFVDDNGNFKILGMDDGVYTFTFTPNDGYQILVVENVVVEEGVVLTLDPITLLPIEE